MNKKFKFVYDSGADDGMDLFPVSSVIRAEHMFEDGSRWQPILYQFCKFLESTGYVGVKEKVVIVDPFSLDYDNHLFKTIRALPEDEDEFGWDDDDFETEDTRDDEELEEDPEMKKETA